MIISDAVHSIPAGTPVSGQTVNLYDSAGVLLDTTTTNSAGVFTFDLDLPPGPVYYTTTVGGVTKRHSTWGIQSVGPLDLSALVPFQSIWTNGVNPVYGDQMQVTATGSTMVLTVGTGSAIVDGQPVRMDVAQNVTVNAAHPSQPRIDLVYLAVYNEAASLPGKVEVGYLAGTPSSSPGKPTPTIPDGNYIELASIRVDAGVSVIATNKVTDLRGMTYPEGTGLEIEKDNILQGQASGIDVKSPLYATYYDASTPADIAIFRGRVTPVTDASIAGPHGSNISGTADTLLDTADELPALHSGQAFRIVVRAWVHGEGISALCDGRIGIKVGDDAIVYSPTQRWEHGVNATNNTVHKVTKTGTGAALTVGLYYKGVSGTFSAQAFGLDVTATPIFTPGT